MAPTPSRLQNFLGFLAQGDALQMPMLFVVIIGMLIIPMPPWVLDVMLVFNIGLTLMVLLRTTAVLQPLEFSVFPSLLLVATLFRLALNISATRLILSTGTDDGSGQIIKTFGSFVIGQNPVVGVIIFLILVVIQFVVITAGAGRVAEVAARFTLDAMPGKQMAIDADLNAGMIDEATARRRRGEIAREADFYGSMDGASKFVRGDAIAALVMIVVNILGGFAVGIGIHHLDMMQALSQYTTKTVGEGIVTQIPALIMSIATGLIVTRTTSASSLGHDLMQQVLGNPQSLWATAGILSAFALVPGLPKLPFLLGALALSGLAFFTGRTIAATAAATAEAEKAPPAPRTTSTEEMMEMLAIDPLEIEIGYGLIALADPMQGGDLLERITTLRKQIALEMGFVVPPVRVRDNIQLKSTGYAVKLWGEEISSGELQPRHCLAMNNDTALPPLPGAIPTTEPAFGLPAFWIPEGQKITAEVEGYTVVDPTTVLITHLSEIVRSHAHELLTRQDLQALLDKVRRGAPALVDELIPKALSLAEVHRVLQLLLQERVSIRDLNRILSTLGDFATTTRDIDILTEHVRRALARAISQQKRGPDGNLDVITLAPALEELIMSHLHPTPFGTQIVLDPSATQLVLQNVRAQAERSVSLGSAPIIVCSSQIRPYFRRLIEPYFPGMTVLAHGEISTGVRMRSIGMVALT